MRLAEPTEDFKHRGRRFHLYLWKWKKVRFIRYPSGIGVYTYVPRETLLALQLPNGEAYRQATTIPLLVPYFITVFRRFIPQSDGQLATKLFLSEHRTEALKRLSVSELIARFGQIRVTPEDAYASGQCWYGSKSWAENWLGDPAPTLARTLTGLDKLPPIEVSAFISAAIFAAAYVIGDDDNLLAGAGEEQYLQAVAEGRKADGSGAYRLRLLNASPVSRETGNFAVRKKDNRK